MMHHWRYPCNQSPRKQCNQSVDWSAYKTSSQVIIFNDHQLQPTSEEKRYTMSWEMQCLTQVHTATIWQLNEQQVKHVPSNWFQGTTAKQLRLCTWNRLEESMQWSRALIFKWNNHEVPEAPWRPTIERWIVRSNVQRVRIGTRAW